MIEKPKKERRFLKTLGKIGEILLEEVLIKVGSNLIKRIGGKKTLPSILFLFLSISLYAQYPATGNKQRLGYQTTGDGLVYRGRASDTVGIKSNGLNNAYFILDTVNNILYNYIKTKGGWKFSNGDTVIINNTVDTTSLSNRINLKVNISDTASMLLPYLRKADTALMLTPYFKKSDTTSLNLVSRFATKLNISDTSAMLTNYLRTGVAASTYQLKLTNPITGTGTTNYLPKFTGSSLLGTSSIFDNGNIGIGKNNPTIAIDLLNSTSATSAKIRLSTEFADAVRTLTIGSGDGITWNIPNETSQSPYIDVIGGDNTVGGGNFIIKTQSSNRFIVRQNGNVGINTTTPSFLLDVNGTFNASGNSLIGGTLGITGAITLSNLSGSGTRMVTASSTGVLSTQSIPSGTVTSVGITAPSLFTVSNSPITTTGNLALTYSGTALPIANGGTNATSASGARNNLDVDYVFFATTAGAAVSLTSNRVFIVNTGSFSTTTLDLTPATSGRMYMVKNLASGTVVSGASNVIPLNGGSASTAILSAGNVTPQWCTLVCDGTNWHIMQKN